MCLGIPGQVTETYLEDQILMGKVDFGGVSKRVCLAHTPDVEKGQYVIVHVGFALHTIDEAEARQVFAFLERMNELDELNVTQAPAGEAAVHELPFGPVSPLKKGTVPVGNIDLFREVHSLERDSPLFQEADRRSP